MNPTRGVAPTWKADQRSFARIHAGFIYRMACFVELEATNCILRYNTHLTTPQGGKDAQPSVALDEELMRITVRRRGQP
jgi:hypothetical protein